MSERPGETQNSGAGTYEPAPDAKPPSEDLFRKPKIGGLAYLAEHRLPPFAPPASEETLDGIRSTGERPPSGSKSVDKPAPDI